MDGDGTTGGGILGGGVDSTDTGPDPATMALLRLSMLPGLGPRTLTALLERFDTAEQVLSAGESDLAMVHGVGAKLIHTIRTASHHVDVETLVTWCHENEVTIVRQGQAGFPRSLEQMVDTPPILFVRGGMVPQDTLAISIVGTRHGSVYGLKQAERFGYALAKAGVTVISGMARGIDAAAHQGALHAAGRTIAVLGSGLGQIYPPEHKTLADSIASSGAVISEYGPDAKPRAGMFPQRNRLIAAMGVATLVIEAPDRSGALITARLACEMNRDVLALPGPVTSRTSRGCNQLIRDGARLVQTVDDVLEELGPMFEPVESGDGLTIRSGSELRLNELERDVLNAIDQTSTPIDQVIAKTQLPAYRVIATISVLEMRSLIRRLSGQYVTRI
ncbi:DNA-processing protein DprA [Novipirellula artificiosorum]|uniref:Uncharacterized protein n=1 Tax=Novipirellula artificiosorum TaxID=2528016 RepID=A0A5C6DZ51_9BACT|nr:DNA-processing protein DprA [Novipirellula artificiosorum]TWU41920.1 hypothetical protein Poly41_02130 [Novipirellula artificiosorum]